MFLREIPYSGHGFRVVALKIPPRTRVRSHFENSLHGQAGAGAAGGACRAQIGVAFFGVA